MNEQNKAELERLLRRQEALQMQIADLRVDIRQLSSRWNQAEQFVPEILHEPIAPLSIVPEPVVEEPAKMSIASVHEEAPVLPPLPPVILPATVTQTNVEPSVAASEGPRPVSPAASSVGVPPRETFEMKLGTYWLVRVGIVMLLTGLVFLGNYAYKNFIGKFGPAGKVTLLYAASAALLGFGGWLQRKREKESLRNYGQVLFAGGLAAVYFTTYAAHHIERLRVIGSPLLDALLLLAWGAFTIWIADRRKSEVLALFAVGLSYYASAITDIGVFTLGSNLVLTAAAVFFLVRNRWTTLSFISVLATYGGFAFWRFHHGDWGWNARIDELRHGNLFLACYWMFFTAAVFLARGKSFVNVNRALFASLNNGAFFFLVLLSMFHFQHGYFWKFSLGFGTALLAAALAARKFLTDEPVVKDAYLVQGLALATVGFVAHYTGLKLALILTAESVILIYLGALQKNIWLRIGGYVTAALSTVWVLTAMTGNRADVLVGSVIGAAFLLAAWWEQRCYVERAKSSHRASTGYFVALAIIVCGFVTWHAVPEEWRVVAWLIEAVALTILFYGVRIRELPTFAQALAVAAQTCWFLQFTFQNTGLHWRVPIAFVLGTLALSFLGHRQKNLFLRASAYLTAAVSVLWLFTRMTGSPMHVTIGAIMGAAFLLNAWWEQSHDERRTLSVVRPWSGCFVGLAVAVCGIVTWHAVPDSWRAAGWMIEAVLLTALFYGIRIPELPLFAQGLAVTAQGYWFFAFALGQGKPHWWVPATLVAGTLALSHWWQRQRRLELVNDVRNVIQIIYGLAFVGVLFFWLQPRFAPAAWLAFVSVLAIGLTLYGVMTRAWALAACAQLFLLISSVEMWQQFLTQKPGWQFALVPLATWLVLGVGATAWLSRHDAREAVRQPLLHLSTFYRGVAFLMSLWWIYAYVTVVNYFWVLCAVGLLLVALAGVLRNREALTFGALYLVVAFAVWFTSAWDATETVSWQNALAILAVFVSQQLVRRSPTRFQCPPHVDTVSILAAGLALWIFISRWVVITSGAHFLLTASWAALAAGLFMTGFALRERMHRWLGLGILAFAVARVFISDVWKLETIYRILSFMALGIVLLTLGFIYNKYQDRIRQWL